MSEFDSDRLWAWPEIAPEYRRPGLLLGNGASQAVWENFGYTSLYTKACSLEIEHRLTAEDQAIFDGLESRNFERVLNALAVSEVVCAALAQDADLVRERYESIRHALIDAVRAVHVPHKLVPLQTFLKIRRELLNYATVFSTNYDLLNYWAMMAEGEGAGFKDAFLSGEFDASKDFEGGTLVLYPHGGIHIYQTHDGVVIKRQAEADANLLELFGVAMENGALPLFVSEGSSDDKMRAIRESEYLRYCYRRLQRFAGRLVVFGSALGETDDHIVDAMRAWGPRPIAISMRPSDDDMKIRSQMLYLRSRLPAARLQFFDSTTHPLGDPALRVQPEESDEDEPPF